MSCTDNPKDHEVYLTDHSFHCTVLESAYTVNVDFVTFEYVLLIKHQSIVCEFVNLTCQ